MTTLSDSAKRGQKRRNMTPLERLLGLVYVSVWSVSMYPPLLLNWRRKSARAVSLDFAMLNAAGYTYLLVSMVLQFWAWDSGEAVGESRPLVSAFDMWYCGHGFTLNLVLLSQLLCGKQIWGFDREHTRRPRMKLVYSRILQGSLVVFALLSARFIYSIVQHGWVNSTTLQFCNRLYALKISMSLIKYLPQVKHNRDRQSVEGFSIHGVALDVTGGVASLLQLFSQLGHEQGFSGSVLMANFGKIGISMVTLLFNSVFVSQWLIYRVPRPPRSKV